MHDGVSLGIVAPDGRDGMVQHAAQFAAAGIPFIFDPGQGLPMFGGEDLKTFIDQASWVAVNDYEWSLLTERTGWNEAEVTQTRGRADRHPWRRGFHRIHCRRQARHSAGAGARGGGPDRLRRCIPGRVAARLLHGLPWEKTGRIASLMGSLKIESRGTQNHTVHAGRVHGSATKPCSAHFVTDRSSQDRESMSQQLSVHVGVGFRRPSGQGFRPDFRRRPRRHPRARTNSRASPPKRFATPAWWCWPARSPPRPRSTTRPSRAT